MMVRRGQRSSRYTCSSTKRLPSSVVKISENVPLAPFTTFRIGGPARFFAVARCEDDIFTALKWAAEHSLPVFPIGGGSNLLVPDTGYEGLVLAIHIRGIERNSEVFTVGAGEDWDSFAQHTANAGLAGIECLVGIPGCVGGTPVQNVGAYGQEVSETITSVRAFDRQQNTLVELTNEQCAFRYRESLFNTTERGRYIVTSVKFQLRVMGAPTLRYADLKKRFLGEPNPSLREVAETVRNIRRDKGMVIIPGDPDTQSAGSFFKNPIIDAALLPQVTAAAAVDIADVPHWPAGPGRTKLAAAWLLERAGFVKGYGTGPVRISSKHTLALTNQGGATYADLVKLQNEIVDGVARKFGVHLEREPVLLT